MTSYNTNDIQFRYCGNCHRFHIEMANVTSDTKPALTSDNVHLSAVRKEPTGRDVDPGPVGESATDLVADRLTCPRCNRTTSNPDYVRDKWCGYCADYHPGTMPDWLREDFAARGEPLPDDVAAAPVPAPDPVQPNPFLPPVFQFNFRHPHIPRAPAVAALEETLRARLAELDPMVGRYPCIIAPVFAPDGLPGHIHTTDPDQNEGEDK